MRVAMAQINPTVGDLQGNLGLVREAIRRGEDAQAQLVVLSELCISGYPPKDLLERLAFVRQCRHALEELAAGVKDTAALVGYPEENPNATGKPVFNSAALLHRGKILAQVRKTLLPTYDIFDENRYFEPATENMPVQFCGGKIGLTICEDIWNDRDFWPKHLYRTDPVAGLIENGAQVVLNISSSPYDLGKEDRRLRMLRSLVAKHRVPLIYVNQVGGNDELIFDGNSVALAADGSILARGNAFDEDFLVVDTDSGESLKWVEAPLMERLHDALVLGTRDYARKCGFRRAVIGLSGGIDSAVTACLATEALGKDNVMGVSMPSRYSSEGSVADARFVAEKLGIEFRTISIEGPFAAYLSTLAPVFGDREQDVTEENIQARIRGNLLMAISNKFGHLLLSTGNKSELAVGYCTLYGDMAGGLAVIADVPKTRVYQLARYINEKRSIIPDSVLTKPPSAELRPNQADQDTLPPYEVLDPILEAYIEDALELDEIAAQGYERELVKEIMRRVEANEYKRYQAPPALKVTPRAFGTGWRMPIARSRQR